MRFQPTPDELEEIRRDFFDELKSDLSKAEPLVQAFGEGTVAAARELSEIFHRQAGSSHVAGLSVLGHFMGTCEKLSKLGAEGDKGLLAALPGVFQHALAAMGAALEVKVVDLATQISRELPPVSEPSPGADLNSAHQPSRVLVVDDDLATAKYMTAIIRAAGMIGSYCCDPESALRSIVSDLPDLIILDVSMPRVNGFEICKQVRAHPALQLTPVLFVTHSHDVQQRIRGLEVGANDYLLKPIHADELVARMRAHLARLEELRDMAIRDGLTRCFNHMHLKARLEQEVARAKRYRDPVALAMLDIDHFKLVNDRSGHSAGDAVLAQMGNIIINCLRTTDIVGRHGGEEFGIVMVRAPPEQSADIAERIRASIEQTKFLVPSSSQLYVELSITVSLGLAQLQPDESTQSLMARADSSLYQAKRSGRNRVCIAP